MFELPSTEVHYQKRQSEFNRRLYAVYDDAKEIVEERAQHYDTQRPVWERVPFPDGFLYEVSKKIGRVKAQTGRGESCMVPAKWAHTREDILDAANYLLFMVVYGDMLFDEMFSGAQHLDEGTAQAVVDERARRNGVAAQPPQNPSVLLTNAQGGEAREPTLEELRGVLKQIEAEVTQREQQALQNAMAKSRAAEQRRAIAALQRGDEDLKPEDYPARYG